MKQNWKNAKFGDVVRLCKDRSSDPLADGIERYVAIEHIEPEDLRIRSWGLVEDGTTFTQRFKAGQTLFVKRRAYQRKVAVADFEGVCSGDIYVLEPKNDRLLPELLPFICQTDRFFAHAVNTSAGSLSPRTNWSQLAAYEFALPPVEEQRRMVEVLGAIDSQIEALLELEHSLTSVRSAALVACFGDDRSPPSDWRKLEDYAVRIGDGTHQPPKFAKMGVPFLLVSNVATGRLDSDFQKWVSEETYSELTKTFRPSRGDVLYTLVGSYGVPVYVDWTWDFAFQRHIGFIRTDENQLHSKFLYYFLQSLPALRQANRFAEGLAQKTITLKSLRAFRLPIPATNEQDRIVQEMEEVDQAITAVVSRKSDLVKIRAQVLQSMLGSSNEL